jgi:hypothetical protein
LGNFWRKNELTAVNKPSKLFPMKNKLISLVTQWDIKRKKSKTYNPYALGIYFGQLDKVLLDIELGADPRAAIVAGFNDRLRDFLLKNLGFALPTPEEIAKSGIYRPVSKNHPDR